MDKSTNKGSCTGALLTPDPDDDEDDEDDDDDEEVGGASPVS